MSNVINAFFEAGFIELISDSVAASGVEKTKEEMIRNGFNESFVKVILKKVVRKKFKS